LQDSAGFVSCCFGLHRRVARMAPRGDDLYKADVRLAVFP